MTLRAKNQNIVIGPIWQKKQLSRSDVKRIHKLYTCRGETAIIPELNFRYNRACWINPVFFNQAIKTCRDFLTMRSALSKLTLVDTSTQPAHFGDGRERIRQVGEALSLLANDYTIEISGFVYRISIFGLSELEARSSRFAICQLSRSQKWSSRNWVLEIHPLFQELGFSTHGMQK